MKSVHVKISGKVQGVYFRVHTCEKATELGVFGWVRNLPDGRVEVLVQGDAEPVEKLVDWCRTGPPRARVDNVECSEGPVEPHFSNFSILR